MKKHFSFLILLMLVAGVVLSACKPTPADDPASAIENYWKALVAKDSARLSGLSCAAFELEALTTLDSFKSVEVKVENLACNAADKNDTSATVKCSGKITASYGAENLVIDLSARTYSAVEESGDWRMCGEK
jgi:hypothetical protein